MRNSNSLVFQALIFALIGLAVSLLPASPKAEFPQFGQNDFVEYWAAVALYREGKDMYDPVLISEKERAQGWKEEKPLMMWNPPWFLPLFDVFMTEDFSQSAQRFFGIQIFLILMSCSLLLQAFDSKGPIFPSRNWFLCCFFAFFSIPILFTLLLGQLSIFLFFAASGLFWSLKRQRSILAGIFLFLLTVKIHVVFLSLLPLLWLPRQIFFKLAVSSLSTAALALGSFWLLRPDAFQFWLARGAHRHNPLLVDVYRWKTTALVTHIREFIAGLSGTSVAWPMFVVPILAALIFLLWLIRRANAQNWDYYFLLALPLSCSLAPFAWIFDASVCQLTQVSLVAYGLKNKSTRALLRILSSLTLLQTSVLVHICLGATSYEEFWYYCPCLAIIFALLNKHQRKTSSA